MPSSLELVVWLFRSFFFFKVEDEMGGLGVVVFGVDLARRVAAREEAGSDRVGDLGMLLSASLALSSSS